jgi:hypothetical protein
MVLNHALDLLEESLVQAIRTVGEVRGWDPGRTR